MGRLQKINIKKNANALFFMQAQQQVINHIMRLFFIIFSFNKGILFIGGDVNFNYLPVPHRFFQKRSPKHFLKMVRFYKVGVIIFLNSKKFKYTYKILRKNKVITVIVGDSHNDSDFFLNITRKSPNLYILYFLFLQMYLRYKK